MITGKATVQRNYYNFLGKKQTYEYWIGILTPYIIGEGLDMNTVKSKVPPPNSFWQPDKYSAYNTAMTYLYKLYDKQRAELYAVQVRQESDVLSDIGFSKDKDGNIVDKKTGKIIVYANSDDAPKDYTTYYVLGSAALLLLFLILKKKKKA